MNSASLDPWALVIVLTKHFLVDFVLEPHYRLRSGPGPLHVGRAVWSALHAVGSLPAVLLLADAPWLIAAAVLAEFILVYGLGWGRDNPALNAIAQRALTGAEQLMHQLYYVALVVALA